MSSSLFDSVSAVFSDSGALAETLPGFEPRDGQRRMAEAVAAVLDTGGTLLAEAGTGTGKTLAYLAPAILSGQRVLVSTGTKNLQEQIYFKDLPALASALDVTFTATLMKGRSNYLCLHRFQAMEGTYESSGMFEPGDGFDRGAAVGVGEVDLSPGHPRVGGTHGHRRSGGTRRPAGRPGAVEPHLGDGRHLPRRRVPAVHRLLRHADAPARQRLRRRDRQPPPAVRRRVGAQGRRSAR